MDNNGPETPPVDLHTPGFRLNWRVLVYLVASVVIIGWAVVVNLPPHRNPEKSFSEFKKLVEDGDLLVTPDKPLAFVEEPRTGKQYIEGRYLERTPDGKEHEYRFSTHIDDLGNRRGEILALLASNKRHPEYTTVTMRYETKY